MRRFNWLWMLVLVKLVTPPLVSWEMPLPRIALASEPASLEVTDTGPPVTADEVVVSAEVIDVPVVSSVEPAPPPPPGR